ncbi:MAG: ABC transporter permease [Chloroflexi bacterium RBG_16_57_8]|nr:MAG: ABC transporter permease [Chloroflexi bacterium RBG_16_57_8]
MSEALQLVISGLAVGMVYALIALGFVVVWKSSGVANLALGQLVLVSSVFVFGVVEKAGQPLWLGFLLLIVFAPALGWLIERTVLRPLIAQPILSLITVTLGVGYFLEGVVVLVWPGTGSLPRFFPTKPLHLGTAVVSQEYLWIAAISVLVFVILSLFYRFHKMGIAMRATADDQLAVQACGVPVTRIFSRSWMFACMVAAVGGVLVSSIGGVSHGLVDTGLKSFSVVILGGLDSFTGALVAGPIIGLAESLGGGYLTPVLWPGVKDIIPFVVIIIVVLVRPYGIFGEARIERI